MITLTPGEARILAKVKSETINACIIFHGGPDYEICESLRKKKILTRIKLDISVNERQKYAYILTEHGKRELSES